jgi:hypothetical protein
VKEVYCFYNCLFDREKSDVGRRIDYGNEFSEEKIGKIEPPKEHNQKDNAEKRPIKGRPPFASFLSFSSTHAENK